MSNARRIVRNSLFLYALTFSNYFVGLLLFPYISRVLSVEGFGLVGFGMAYALIFQSIVEFGFVISATAEISKVRLDADAVSTIVTDTMLAKMLLVVVATPVFFCSALFIPMVRDHMLVLSLFFVSAVTTAMLPDFYFRGVEQMQSIAVRAVATKLFSIALVIAVVRGDEQLAFIPIALIASNLVAVLWAFLSMRKLGFRFAQVRLTAALQSIREGFMYFLSRISTTVNQALGAFALGLTYSAASREMGIFSAAWRISSAGELMVSPVSDSLYPHMINKRDYGLFWRVYRYGLIAWFIGCALAFIFADSICRLVLGPIYAEAGGTLRILLFGSFMAFSSNLFGYNALAPIGLAWHANAALLVSAAINIGVITVLMVTDNVTLESVCIVVTLSNLVIFMYRMTVFLKNGGRARLRNG